LRFHRQKDLLPIGSPPSCFPFFPPRCPPSPCGSVPSLNTNPYEFCILAASTFTVNQFDGPTHCNFFFKKPSLCIPTYPYPCAVRFFFFPSSQLLVCVTSIAPRSHPCFFCCSHQSVLFEISTPTDSRPLAVPVFPWSLGSCPFPLFFYEPSFPFINVREGSSFFFVSQEVSCPIPFPTFVLIAAVAIPCARNLLAFP